MTKSDFDRSSIVTSGCDVAVSQSQFVDGQPNSSGESLSATGGVLAVENCLFSMPSEFLTPVRLGVHQAGSYFRFNTIALTSSVPARDEALNCDASVSVTSNTFAFNGPAILLPDCVANHSLFADSDPIAAARGVGNATGDMSQFFVDLANHNFHPKPGSPGLGLGELGLTKVDLEGSSRPQPSGTGPDVGAFEIQ